jgi:hypothetical protein
MEINTLRQLLYISSGTSGSTGDNLASILFQSRRNNAERRLTGLLWTDGSRFLQVLEGDNAEVQKTFDRIQADDRHRAVVILHDRAVPARTFGAWSMALIGDSDDRIATALVNADPVIRGTFEGLIQTRRAA